MQFQLLSSITFLFIQSDFGSFAGYVEPTENAYAGATLPLIPPPPPPPPPPLYRRPLLKHRYVSSLSPAVAFTDEVQVVKPTAYVPAPKMTYITPIPHAYIAQPRRSYYSPAYQSYFGYSPSYVAPTTMARPYGTYRNAHHLQPRYHPRITVRNLARSYARETAQTSDTTSVFGGTDFGFEDLDMFPSSNFYKSFNSPWHTFFHKRPFEELSKLDAGYGDSGSEGRTTPDIPVHIAVAPATGPIAVAAAFANQHHISDCDWPCPYYYLSKHHHPRAAIRNYLKTFTKESGLTSDTSLYIEKEHSPHLFGLRPLPHIVGPVPLLYTSDVMRRKAAEKKARRLLSKRRAPETEQLRQVSKTNADSHNNL